VQLDSRIGFSELTELSSHSKASLKKIRENKSRNEGMIAEKKGNEEKHGREK
jgi:hypothetical protein